MFQQAQHTFCEVFSHSTQFWQFWFAFLVYLKTNKWLVKQVEPSQEWKHKNPFFDKK